MCAHACTYVGKCLKLCRWLFWIPSALKCLTRSMEKFLAAGQGYDGTHEMPQLRQEHDCFPGWFPWRGCRCSQSWRLSPRPGQQRQLSPWLVMKLSHLQDRNGGCSGRKWWEESVLGQIAIFVVIAKGFHLPPPAWLLKDSLSHQLNWALGLIIPTSSKWDVIFQGPPEGVSRKGCPLEGSMGRSPVGLWQYDTMTVLS